MLAATIYAYSQSVPEATACLISGVMIDLDHLADFYMFSGERFSISNFFSWCYNCRWKKMAIAFHSYEIIATLCTAAYYFGNDVIQGIAWGAALHLLLDQFGNVRRAKLSPWFYFLAYRSAMGFSRDRLQLPLPATISTPRTESDH